MPIEQVDVGVYEFPTPYPEADGTFEWSKTTAVTVQVHAGGEHGLGWTYSSPAAAAVITQHLAEELRERDAHDIPGAWQAMRRAGRNLGARGLYGQALSAADIALWDLKARLLGLPLTDLFGRCWDSVPVYGSGGFITQTEQQYAEQVEGWRAAGCTAMKIKIGEAWGSNIDRDLARMRRLRELAGDGVELMADANGAYSIGQARRVGEALDELKVVWFEEPVSSDDVAGLGTLRAALRCDVTAGEYAADGYEMARLLPVVDCLQLDVTRCGGYSGFLQGAALAAAANRQISGHCAPALHAPIAGALANLRHVEWFADHAALEPLLVDGVPVVRDGRMSADTERPGHGMRLAATAQAYRQD